MLDSNWTIKPKIGLGFLSFGMEPEGVKALSHIYGKPALVSTNDDMVSVVENIDSVLYEHLSTQEIELARKLYLEQAKQEHRSEIYSESGFVLDYYNNKLSSITVSKSQTKLNLEGVYLFAVSSKEALYVLEKYNGQPGKYEDISTEFNNICIYCTGLSLVSDGIVTYTGYESEYFDQTSIMLTNSPIDSDKNSGQYEAMIRSFLDDRQGN